MASMECWNSAHLKIDERIFAKPKLENVESISIDYAILEKEEDAAFLSLMAIGRIWGIGKAFRKFSGIMVSIAILKRLFWSMHKTPSSILLVAQLLQLVCRFDNCRRR